MIDVISGHILYFASVVVCLQVEPCDDTTRNDASGILNNNNDVITNHCTRDAKQVNNFKHAYNFIFHDFVTSGEQTFLLSLCLISFYTICAR